MTEKTENKKAIRELIGMVVSDKMDKTIVVRVDRQIRHKKYHKFITRTKKYKAHDGNSEAKMGDLVRLVEIRPLSKQKRFMLKEIVRKACVAAGVNV
ncbi:MAG: 30S ribosomal protein S17 [Bdellovibrionaceae bacterium]|nr:30S ribosomal protein S17 [Pseudobdellovibrionaceae bacterium]